jgi:hypothetical protein
MVDRSQLVIPKDRVDTIADWVHACTPGDVLVITSEVPGCGVTTMLETLERGDHITYIRDPTQCGYGTKTVLGEKKILLIDPFDEYIIDQTKQKRVMEQLDERTLPIIVAGIRRRVSKAKIDDAFGTIAKRKRVTTVHIEKPDRDTAINILKSLGIVNPGAIWDESGGDFRHCIESSSMPQTEDASFVRECIPDGIEALTRLLSRSDSRAYKDTVRMTDGDINLLIDGVFENYTSGIDSLDTASDVLDILERCDVMQNYIYHDPSSEYQEISGLLAGVQYLPCCVTKHITKHGTIWAKENHKYTKAKLVRYLKSRGLCMDDASCIREMVCQDPGTQTPRLTDAYGSKAVWNATRLWMKRASAAGYTKKRHEDLIQSQQARRPRD